MSARDWEILLLIRKFGNQQSLPPKFLSTKLLMLSTTSPAFFVEEAMDTSSLAALSVPKKIG